MNTYNVTFRNNKGTNLTIESNISNVHNAFEKMMDEAMHQMKALLIEGLDDVKAEMTSNNKYPNAWGYGNNGVCIRYNLGWYQFEVVEA